MPALVTTASSLSCTHGGPATPQGGDVRVKVQGQPVLTAADMATVAGCPYVSAETTKRSPCVTARWVASAGRVKASGKPVLLQGNATICQSAEQIPQGSAIENAHQQRVRGS